MRYFTVRHWSGWANPFRLFEQEWIQGGKVRPLRRCPLRMLRGFLQKPGRKRSLCQLPESEPTAAQDEAEEGWVKLSAEGGIGPDSQHVKYPTEKRIETTRNVSLVQKTPARMEKNQVDFTESACLLLAIIERARRPRGPEQVLNVLSRDSNMNAI